MVKSLVELCTAVCIKNIKDVTDIGSMAYPTVRTILLQINSAKQLRHLEINSPQLEGDDAECWIRLINRDFPVLAKRHNFEPKNPTSWHKIYARYERLEAEQKREAEEKLKAAFAGIKKEKQENVSTIVDFDRRKLPRPPRDGRGGGGPRKPGMGRRGGGPDEGDLRFTGGTRTKVTSAQSILKKARREAREISARNRLATPTGLLPVNRSQIISAPKGMVEAARIKAQPATRIHAPGAPSKHEQKHSRELEEREARLRKMKNMGANKGATVVSDSDLEDEDGYDDDEDGYDDGDVSGPGGLDPDELEDIFDEKPKPPPTRATKPTTTSTSSGGFSASTTRSNITKRSGLLSNAPGSSKNNLIVSTKPAPKPTTSKPASISTSKPVSASTNPKSFSPPLENSSPPKHAPPVVTASSMSPELKPQASMPPRKRKPVDIFMKPKPKMQKR